MWKQTEANVCGDESGQWPGWQCDNCGRTVCTRDGQPAPCGCDANGIDYQLPSGETVTKARAGFLSIVCPTHGPFEQRADFHLIDNGCPRCKAIAEIERNFTYHPPKPGQPERYAILRAKAKELALLIEQECPASRERSVALTELETCVFWSNAAIARNE